MIQSLASVSHMCVSKVPSECVPSPHLSSYQKVSTQFGSGKENGAQKKAITLKLPNKLLLKQRRESSLFFLFLIHSYLYIKIVII